MTFLRSLAKAGAEGLVLIERGNSRPHTSRS
jgi:hypothetical protein